MQFTKKDMAIAVVCGMVIGTIMKYLLFSSNPLWVMILFAAIGAMVGIQLDKRRKRKNGM